VAVPRREESPVRRSRAHRHHSRRPRPRPAKAAPSWDPPDRVTAGNTRWPVPSARPPN